MITDFHDVFGSMSAEEFLPDIRATMGGISCDQIAEYLVSSWDEMYGSNSEAIKPDMETFHAWAIQVLEEYADYKQRIAA